MESAHRSRAAPAPHRGCVALRARMRGGGRMNTGPVPPWLRVPGNAAAETAAAHAAATPDTGPAPAGACEHPCAWLTSEIPRRPASCAHAESAGDTPPPAPPSHHHHHHHHPRCTPAPRCPTCWPRPMPRPMPRPTRPSPSTPRPPCMPRPRLHPHPHPPCLPPPPAHIRMHGPRPWTPTSHLSPQPPAAPTPIHPAPSTRPRPPPALPSAPARPCFLPHSSTPRHSPLHTHMCMHTRRHARSPPTRPAPASPASLPTTPPTPSCLCRSGPASARKPRAHATAVAASRSAALSSHPASLAPIATPMASVRALSTRFRLPPPQ